MLGTWKHDFLSVPDEEWFQENGGWDGPPCSKHGVHYIIFWTDIVHFTGIGLSGGCIFTLNIINIVGEWSAFPWCIQEAPCSCCTWRILTLTLLYVMFLSREKMPAYYLKWARKCFFSCRFSLNVLACVPNCEKWLLASLCLSASPHGATQLPLGRLN